jgi:ribosomal protein S18 acetylase RimI-like enzyme
MADIRPAEPGDVSGIRRVATAGWNAAYGEFMPADTIETVLDEWYSEPKVRRAVEDSGSSYLVAIDDGIVVGFASAGPAQGGDAETAQLYVIYVDPARWGDGIGTDLLAAVSERLSNRGFQRLLVQVLAENEVGRSFYEGHGFDQVAQGVTELGGDSYDEVRYEDPL